jgi:hypothetical protein
MRVMASRRVKELRIEIEKCIVLCHNCHEELHYPHLAIQQ